MFKLLKYMKWYYYLIALVIGVIVYYQVSFDLQLADYMQQIVMLIMSKADSQEILKVGGQMLLTSLGSVVARISVSYLAIRVASDFSKRLRKLVYDKVDSYSMEEIGKFSTASLITRTTNDIQQVQIVVMQVLNMAITAPMMAIRGISKAYGVSGEITTVVAVGIIFLVTMIFTIFTIAMPRFKKIQNYIDDMNLVTRENLTGIRVIRAYNGENKQEEKFEKVNDKLTRTQLFINRTLSLIDPFMALTLNGVSLGIVWLGAFLISQGRLGGSPLEGLGQITSFTMYAVQIIFSFMMLSFFFIFAPRASVSANRINEILSTNSKIVDPVNETPQTAVKGEIEFRNVSFKYPDAESCVIEDINLKINQGETVAFVGSTGSGKSTLINLVPRFFDVTSGELLINNIDVKDYKLEDLHDILGYVPQQGVLFTGTIASNMQLGEKEISQEEMLKALEVAQASEFVNKLDEGLNAPISQGGKNVSGGQKQRLCIARAIVKQPQIYIFDDSFSALDYKTDRALRKALKEYTKDATSLIVAQRIGTILHADKIVVLDHGKIVGVGTHKELLKTCEVYQEMAYSQLSKEELDNVK
jgi:ATP-binding cassette subfamily B protein